MKSPENLLHQYNMRTTESRRKILACFQSEEYALSHADLESQLEGAFDRVTIYRTLKTFLDKGILHKVPDDTGNLKYALCPESCLPEAHQHEHVHFKCLQCGQTICLDKTFIPRLVLPAGYEAIETNLLVSGVCAECNP
ncbi:MAG: transcriptional repressor [Microscillaceae bacterium]|nr:transcriptional repressor [Microscillaceae bacterium]